jgi:two-component system OmpR family sensor kinase
LLTLRRAAERAVAEGGVEVARGELIGAVALAELFERIETEAMLDRARVDAASGGRSARAFLDLIAAERDQTFRELIARAVERERRRAAEAFARLDAVGRRFALWGGALGVAALVAAAAFARGFHRRLVRPIDGLARAAAAFGAGARDARAPAALPREFAPLGARFDAMAERLAGEQARLETEVAERTADLAEANAALRDVDARRRRMFAALSHEIRTPVTALLGEAQIALRQPESEGGAAREALERIAASGGYLRRRLDDLLSLARSEDGALTLEMAHCDLAAAARRAVEATRGYAEAAEASLRFEAPDAPVMLGGRRRGAAAGRAGADRQCGEGVAAGRDRDGLGLAGARRRHPRRGR